MEAKSYSDAINKASDRSKATKNLFQAISLSDEENAFLNQAAKKVETWAVPTLDLYSTKLLEAALAKHSEALVRSAEASDKHSVSLSCATWALVGATVITGLATLLLAIVEILKTA